MIAMSYPWQPQICLAPVAQVSVGSAVCKRHAPSTQRRFCLMAKYWLRGASNPSVEPAKTAILVLPSRPQSYLTQQTSTSTLQAVLEPPALTTLRRYCRTETSLSWEVSTILGKQ